MILRMLVHGNKHFATVHFREAAATIDHAGKCTVPHVRLLDQHEAVESRH